MKHLRKRLTYANVMSSIAVFLVVGGGAAFAALGKNTVGTKQLKRNAVKVGKIGPEAVKAGKLAKNAVSTNRIRDNAVTTGKIVNGAILTDKIGDDQVTGAKVDESSLGEVPKAAESNKVGGVPASALTIGRSGNNPSCFGAADYPCASVTLSLPRSGRVLLVSQLPMHPDADNSSASCRITRNGVDVPQTTTTPGALTDAVSDEGSEIANGGVTVVTGVIGAGDSTFTQVCSDTGGNPHFRNTSISAVLLGTD